MCSEMTMKQQNKPLCNGTKDPRIITEPLCKNCIYYAGEVEEYHGWLCSYIHEWQKMSKEIIPTKEDQIAFHRKAAAICGSLMYDNPGKYSRFYGQPVPFGYEATIKELKKQRDFHKRQAKKLYEELEE